ncbi:hypothetical protein [Moorena sp. SIO4G3]|nr:hypothetical protein [Moorena sp. SIO4G3]NEO75353.1 hypothetical protein [Moorena sp. SIO4G3]
MGRWGELSRKYLYNIIHIFENLYVIKVPTRRKKPTLVSYSLLPNP